LSEPANALPANFERRIFVYTKIIAYRLAA